MSLFETIKANLDLIDTAKQYGVEINRSGFTSCLFHTERTPSLKLYHDHFHCFGCGKSGVNAGTIANTLNSEHLLIPSAYKYEHGIVSKPRACKDPYFWNATTIHKLLDTQEYIGDTVNFKTYSNFYKDSKSRENDKDKRLIFKDTHSTIISAEIWEMVQKMRGA